MILAKFIDFDSRCLFLFCGLIIDVLQFAASLEVLLFIWLPEVDLLIASVNCWRGVQIGFNEMHLGMIYLSS